jgi:hypothetical protein
VQLSDFRVPRRRLRIRGGHTIVPKTRTRTGRADSVERTRTGGLGRETRTGDSDRETRTGGLGRAESDGRLAQLATALSFWYPQGREFEPGHPRRMKRAHSLPFGGLDEA